MLYRETKGCDAQDVFRLALRTNKRAERLLIAFAALMNVGPSLSETDPGLWTATRLLNTYSAESISSPGDGAISVDLLASPESENYPLPLT